MMNAPSDPDANNQLRRFYRTWCLKESVVKALGFGIDINLKAFEFTIQDAEETTTVSEDRKKKKERVE